MCIHRENKDSLRATANYLAGYGVTSLRLNDPQSLGIWKQYADEYALTEDEVWEIYKAYIPQYFADGMPVDLDLDGYFHCGRGETAYTVPYEHHAAEDTDWSRRHYCGSVQTYAYIGPEGRVAPCMGFSDTALKDRFPSVLEKPLGELTLSSYYQDVVETRVSELLDKNPECRSCPHLPSCCGGCMLDGITEEGDYLVPDGRCCYFHKHIGGDAVRKAADEGIRAAGLSGEKSV